MRTTAIVVEHLAIGVQTSLWIALLIASFFGYEWIINLAPLTQFTIVAIALFVVYPVGVFMDEFSDYIFDSYDRKIRREHIQDDTQTTFRLLILLKDPTTAQYFQYLRSRIRIARSSFINFLLLTGATGLFTIRQLSERLGSLTTIVVITEIAVGLLLSMLAFFSWWRVSDTFAKRIKWGYYALEAAEHQRDQRKPRKKSS